jgi:allophanate hydrolase subunit 2
VRVLPAAEYDNFDTEATRHFWQADWKITAQSDRYGYRLSGPALGLKQALETRSHGVVPGVIQVPPGGQAIIQMQDAQPSGGYPKIGTVIEADLWRLAQAPAGSRVRFVQTTYGEALIVNQTTVAYLAKVRRLIATYRGLHV